MAYTYICIGYKYENAIGCLTKLCYVMNRTEQNRIFITLKLLQFLVTLHTNTTIYNVGDKTGHNNNG